MKRLTPLPQYGVGSLFLHGEILGCLTWTGWPKTSTWDVVFSQVLQCVGSRENGTCEHCCSCKVPRNLINNLCICFIPLLGHRGSNLTKPLCFQLAKLEEETVKWCREIMRNSPMAIRLCKSAINAADDGHAGLQVPPWPIICVTCVLHYSLFRLFNVDFFSPAANRWRLHTFVLRDWGRDWREDSLPGTQEAWLL